MLIRTAKFGTKHSLIDFWEAILPSFKSGCIESWKESQLDLLLSVLETVILKKRAKELHLNTAVTSMLLFLHL